MKNELTIICEEIGVLGDRRFRAVKAAIRQESEKAIQVFDVASGISQWVPKSQVQMINGFCKVPKWIWDQKGFSWFAGPFSILPRLVESN